MAEKIQEEQWLEEAGTRLLDKLRAECIRVGTNIPFAPVGGRYRDCMMPGGAAWWTNGFWPGLLWQGYHATGEEAFRTAAVGVEERLAEPLQSFRNMDHDVGFLFLPSAVADYRTTGSETARIRGLHAANLLAGRFNPSGNFIRAWDNSKFAGDVRGLMIVDCLMNLPLLFWASRETGDPRFAQIAGRHADTSLRTLLREDGSVCHIAAMDPETGEHLGETAGQGYGTGTAWSRGQGWAVYGFSIAYRETKKEEYLSAARRAADFAVREMEAWDWLPPVDFCAPREPVKMDSGAGVILACGLLELSELLGESERAAYTDAARRILRACEEAYADWNPETDGILGGGSTMYHDDRLSNLAIIYGDYFLAEAILRLQGKAMRIF